MDFKTLILRFRDLDIAENETIKRHQSIIDEKDYVWWAWWKKGNEKTPQDEFGALNTQADNSPIEVFLVDSGQRKLYKALCAQIKANKNKKNRIARKRCYARLLQKQYLPRLVQIYFDYRMCRG